MRTICLAVVVLVALVSGPSPAGKLTLDPNVPGASGPTSKKPATKTDERLARKITYEGGYKRLHEVAEELTQLTGVAIRAGMNRQDWRVRDIPLDVCVRDIPLGRLLHALAGCAHVRLRAETVRPAGDTKPSYRFYRTRTDEEDILWGLEPGIKANLALAEWAWDVLVASADVPEAGLDSSAPRPDGSARIDVEKISLVGKALAGLGPEGKETALAGEQVTAYIGDSRGSAELKNLYDYARAHMDLGPEWQPQEPTEEDREHSSLTIAIRRVKRPAADAGVTFIVHGIPVVNLEPPPGQEDTAKELFGWTVDLVQLAGDLASIDSSAPPPPDASPQSHVQEQFEGAGFVALRSEDDWGLPLLQGSVTVERPDVPAESLTAADALAAFSKASGLSIIAEDFVSHRYPRSSASLSWFGTETTPAEFLRRRSRHPGDSLWHVNQKEKQMVAWAKDWREHHKALVPESLLTTIRAKCSGMGAELDDVVPLIALTNGQLEEWVTCMPELKGIALPSSGHKELWLLYNALGPEDRMRAQSETGLLLVKLEPGWLSGFMVQALREIDSRAVSSGTTILPEDPTEFQQSRRAVCDPEIISKAVLKVESVAVVNGHKYLAALEFPAQDADQSRIEAGWWGMTFPYYAPKR